MSEEPDDQSIALSPSLTTVRRLLPLAGKHIWYLPLAFLLLMVMAAVQIMLPQIMRLAIDGPLSLQSTLNKQARWEEIWFLGKLFLGFLLTGFAANYLSTWLLQKFGQSLVLQLRLKVFKKLHSLPISYFDKHAVGRTVTRVVNDSNALSHLFTSVLAAGIGDLIMLTGILVVLLLTDPVLSLILGVFCPVLIFFVFWFRNRSAPLYKTQRKLIARINAYFAEILDGLATVKSFQAQDYQKARFSEMNENTLNNELKLLTLVALFRPGFAVARMLATAALLTVGGYTIIEGHSTLGTLISSLLYIRLLFSPLEQLADKYNILIKATVASERVLTIIDREEETRKSDNATPLKSNSALEFRRVSFHYTPDKPVLRDVSFTLEPGQSLALVGPTGSGKSTIVSLLLGFYPLQKDQGHKGEILVNGGPFEHLDLLDWRSRVAFVSQDSFLFKGSIARNVSLYREMPAEHIEKSLEQAACSEFVNELPQKSQTQVGEKGHALSTGQRQLLSFARALAFDPQLLILDEATANIDSETEQKVEKALDVLLEGRQAIIVAHRLATVKRADKILVLSEGTVVEQGSHSELMAQNGLYSKMVRKAEKTH